MTIEMIAIKKLQLTRDQIEDEGDIHAEAA